MARLTKLPSLEIIRGFKGIIDFYLWKGLPCARKWPRTPRSHLTPATLAAAAVFGAVSKAFPLLSDDALAAFKEDSLDQPRTARDIYMTAVFGKLHEASMSDFLTLLQESRDFLEDLTALLNALHDVNLDEFDVNVEASALPSGASTAAHQVTQNTSLTTIAKLEEALQSVATDRLIVRGEDQLFSYKRPVSKVASGTVSDAGGYLGSHAPPDGLVWVITNITAWDVTSPTTRHEYADFAAMGFARFYSEVATFAAGDISQWRGHLYLDPGDTVLVTFVGSLLGDTCHVELTGYELTKET